ncbi:MAG: hypothetical protein CFH03_01634 [Alphaproteobacteria bacterium MarineAlpha3_Bin2]|nr:MAG: hypothetical protein CFH03_01634 [Alphaproteobacteria bacterium MarineAlpha3_Bin2]
MAEPSTISSLTKILGTGVTIDVVDIGANPIDTDPPYQRLLQAGLARVTGFEPNPEALATLQANKGDNETYLPHAVADGETHEFKVCRTPGMSSLLEPNQELLQYLNQFPDWGTVVRREKINTVRLDDVSEVTNLDYLKIDIQGGELCVFENAPERLSECVAIHSEVEFLPLYVDQPLFSEVELFLRGAGFLFHKFDPLTSRVLEPLASKTGTYEGLCQIFWADAVFIRDFTRFAELAPDKLMKLATILHDVYESFDLVLRTLIALDDQAGSTYAGAYTDAMIVTPLGNRRFLCMIARQFCLAED